jgi:hypothetical protein
MFVICNTTLLIAILKPYLLIEHCFLHKYIFLSVTDIRLKVCGQPFYIIRALLAEFIITYKYIFHRLLNILKID